LFANPLATPDTLGVASGASLGAVVGLFLGVSLISVQLLALAGGLLAVALTILVSRGGRSRGIITMVLSGMILGSLFSALISLFKYVADPESQLPSITYWLMGSLNTASYKNLILGAPFLIAGILMLALLRWRLNILPLSEDEARATGTNLPLLRGLTVVSATMITASAVSMCGQVGWVGLLIPHICRMLWGADNRRLIPASVSLGAVFMVIVDTLARTLTAAELPVSILTAVIGAPVFIALLRKTGGWQL
ncbi:MAG: iron ABC transporter permease, partial [Clostridiales bacterium]|nr:iron ABC transporter permease [Clostridiales bacterium]